MTKKMSKKEEMFWRDLASRMAKHLGYYIRENIKRTRPNCSKKKFEYLVIDKMTFSWPRIVMHGHSWKDIVECLCGAVLWTDNANNKPNIFGDLLLDLRVDRKGREQRLIDLELAGFGDLIDAAKKGKIR